MSDLKKKMFSTIRNLWELFLDWGQKGFLPVLPLMARDWLQRYNPSACRAPKPIRRRVPGEAAKMLYRREMLYTD